MLEKVFEKRQRFRAQRDLIVTAPKPQSDV